MNVEKLNQLWDKTLKEEQKSFLFKFLAIAGVIILLFVGIGVGYNEFSNMEESKNILEHKSIELVNRNTNLTALNSQLEIRVKELEEENKRLSVQNNTTNNISNPNIGIKIDGWSKIVVNGKDCVYQFANGFSYQTCKE